MKSKNNGARARQALARHVRKCTICHHSEREAIEEEFVHWRSVSRIARQYGIEDYRTIYRHARATGLVELRRENIRSALDNIVERSDTTKVSGDCILRAIRAYSCIDEMGRWIDPPSRVAITTTRVNALLPAPEPPAEEVAAAELDPGSLPDDGGLSPAPLIACDTSPSGQDAFEPVAAGSEASLIYGSGIRNNRNSLKTHDKIFSNKIIHLTKARLWSTICLVRHNLQPFLDLAAEAEACNARRKSLLMDATSFLVGTCFSIFFLAFSMRGLR
jgi:hypothetical protein